MRFLGILALSASGLVLGSCADDGGGASVNEDISWYISCAAGSTMCGSGRTYHDMTIAPKKKFSVVCKKIGNVIEFSITDPGSDDDPKTAAPMNELHPGSQIIVRNGDTNNRLCDVTVRDYPSREAASPLEFVGKCAGSSTAPTCEMTGQFNTMGWTWAGTLKCMGMEQVNSGTSTRYNLLDKNGNPIQIAVDNCEGG